MPAYLFAFLFLKIRESVLAEYGGSRIFSEHARLENKPLGRLFKRRRHIKLGSS